jgi:hypothetical protein
MMKRTSTIVWLLALMTALWLALPAGAKNDGTHGKSGSQSQSTESSGGPGNSDHDGDADSDPSTAEEDSHAEESDAEAYSSSTGTSDNAHPSGKDRSAEYGGSGNQGQAESNPDDSKGPMRCEGDCGDDDKSQAYGGTDLEDQDGNNGCGNDDDFNDDNNGHCGGNVTEEEVAAANVASSTDSEGGQIPAESVVVPELGGPNVPGSAGPVPDAVLGETIVAPSGIGAPNEVAPATRAQATQPGALPFTGSELMPLALLGLMLVLTGWGVVKSVPERS